MPMSDELERALLAADPARMEATERTTEELRAQASAIMEAAPRDRPRRDRPRRVRRHSQTLRPARRLALAFAVVAGLVLTLTELPDRGVTGLPSAVQAFAAQLRDPGVLHFKTGEARILAEDGAPAIASLASSYEVWLDLRGSGWRSHQLDDGRVRHEYVADARGVRIRRPGERWSTIPAARLPHDYLRNPFAEGVLVDALRDVRNHKLRVVGASRVRGRSAYVLAAGPALGANGRPLAARNVRYYVDRDDGALLRITTRVRFGSGSDADALRQSDRERFRAARPRTRVQEVVEYEVLPRSAETLRLTSARP